MTRPQGWPPERPNPTGKVGSDEKKHENFEADITAQCGGAASAAFHRLLLQRLASLGLTSSIGQDNSIIVGGKQLDARSAASLVRQLRSL